MTDLADTFGDDFAEHIKKKTAERRQERNRVTEEQLARICSLAINEDKFHEGDPQFQYTTENGIDHDVLLMNVPDPENSEVWKHLSEPWDGAARLPMEYLGQWYWSTFPNKADVRDLEQGEYYIVVGSMEESEGDDGETYYSIYPVRGIASLERAEELAQMDLESEGFASPDEEDEEEEVEEEEESEPEQEEDEEDEEDSSSGGIFGDDEGEEDGDEEEEEDELPYTEEEIREKVEGLAEKQDDTEEPQVYEIDEGSEFHKKITKMCISQLEIPGDYAEGVKDTVWAVIEDNKEEEEEDDDEVNKLF